MSIPSLPLRVLTRREHELATADLRAESRVTERAVFTRALDELQRRMKVIPQDVIYQPTFSYIWTLAEDRFSEELRKPSDTSSVAARRKTALREIARAYLAGAGMTLLGETARASGLSRVEAGSGNHQLVVADEDWIRNRADWAFMMTVKGSYCSSCQASAQFNPFGPE